MKLFLVVLSLFLFVLAANSQNIKMKMTGVITNPEGEDIIAFEMGDTATYTPSGGGGGGSFTTLGFEFVKIKKQKDASTNELFKRSLNGVHSPDATFEFYDGGVLIYKILLKDLLIQHFSYLSPECFNCTKLFHQVWFSYVMIEVTDVATGITTKYNRATRVFY